MPLLVEMFENVDAEERISQTSCVKMSIYLDGEIGKQEKNLFME